MSLCLVLWAYNTFYCTYIAYTGILSAKVDLVIQYLVKIDFVFYIYNLDLSIFQ